MRHVLIYLLIIIMVASCSRSNHGNEESIFNIKVSTVDLPKIITHAYPFSGNIICLDEDGVISVYDTAFVKRTDLSEKFIGLKFLRSNYVNDSLIFSTLDKAFLLRNDFSLQSLGWDDLKVHFRMEIEKFYEDSTYFIYGSCAGEYGGAVFFRSKRTDRVYSYPATCVQQVLKYKSAYLICSQLSHLEGFSSFISIQDPEKLTELPPDSAYFEQWYNTYDSAFYFTGQRDIKDEGVTVYFDSCCVALINTFENEGDLYSIYTTDSLTLIAKHKNYQLETVDTLYRFSNFINRSRTYNNSEYFTCYYSSSNYSSATSVSFYNSTNGGIIWIEGNHIHAYNFNFKND